MGMGTAALAKCEVLAACSPHGEWDPTGRPVLEPAFRSLFDGIDRNGDGILDRSEWSAAFGLLDENQNGKISRAEWTHAMGHTYMFDLIDADGGGTINREEWERAWDVFDKDHDGKIEAKEWETWGLKVRAKVPPTSASRRTASSSASQVPSNRAVLETCVRPCVSKHVLKVIAEEGFDRGRESTEARELLNAAVLGATDAVARLLRASKGSSLLLATDRAGNSALHFAASSGNLHITGLLIKSKAPLDAQNLEGEVPLHGACDGGYAEVVEALCDAHADSRYGDFLGNEAPAMRAVRRHTERARSRAGSADHRDRLLVCIEACLRAMQRWDPGAPAATSLTSRPGVTALHLAAEASDFTVCKLLLDFEAAVDAKENIEGATALMYALRAGADMPVVTLLLDARADLRLRDRCGGQPLHYAVASGDKGMALVRLLLKARTDVNAVDMRGASPVAIAGMCDAPNVVRCLLAAGASTVGLGKLVPFLPMASKAGENRSCRQILEAVSIGGYTATGGTAGVQYSSGGG